MLRSWEFFYDDVFPCVAELGSVAEQGEGAGQRGVARQGGRAGQGGGADQWGVVQLGSAAAGLPAGCCCLHPVSRHGCVQC